MIRFADLKKLFSKGDTNNWSKKLYGITENTHDKKPSYRIDKLPERYNECLLKKTKLSMKEINEVMKKLKRQLD